MLRCLPYCHTAGTNRPSPQIPRAEFSGCPNIPLQVKLGSLFIVGRERGHALVAGLRRGGEEIRVLW